MTEKKGFIARLVGKFASETTHESNAAEDACCSGSCEETVKPVEPVVEIKKEESSCCGGCGGSGH